MKPGTPVSNAGLRRTFGRYVVANLPHADGLSPCAFAFFYRLRSLWTATSFRWPGLGFSAEAQEYAGNAFRSQSEISDDLVYLSMHYAHNQKQIISG